jgi:predicted TIM-barrel fold metal-dependent hydrolase
LLVVRDRRSTVVIDAHTHLMEYVGHIRPAKGGPNLEAGAYWKKHHRIPDWVVEPYLEAMEWVDRCIVLAWPYPDDNIARNECVAQFVREHGDKFVPFYNVNPSLPTAMSDLERAVEDWGAKGIKMSSVAMEFKPDDEGYFPVYERIEELGLPIVWNQGSIFVAPEGPLEWSMPWMLDKVARTFPSIKIIISHFGFPWVREVVALLRKRPNVYTDISCLATRTWVLYNALVDALQYGAEEKIFFGSDYPMFTPTQMRDALYETCSIPTGTNLPPLPREVIDEMMNRDCLQILGID